jgi:hypothetical protein
VGNPKFEPTMTMARSVMILDESLVSLQRSLEAKNFKVYKMEADSRRSRYLTYSPTVYM